MILYHGSYLEIQAPNLLHSRKNVDFGRGVKDSSIVAKTVLFPVTALVNYPPPKGSGFPQPN